MKKYITSFAAFVLGLIAPGLAYAQNCKDSSLSDVDRYFNGVRYCTANSVLVKVVGIVFTVAGMAAVVFIVYGGILYITSAGNDEAAKSGRKTVMYALLGLVLIILAYTIVSVVSNTAKSG